MLPADCCLPVGGETWATKGVMVKQARFLRS